MSRRLLAVLVAAGLLLLTGCSSGGSDQPDAKPGRPAAVSTVASDLQPCPAQPDRPAASTDLPDLRLTCFSGGSLDLGKAPGVPMVVNFWASWCSPCRDELPLVQQLADLGGNRLRVVGLVSKDGVTQATSFADDEKVTFPSAFDADGDVMTKLGFATLPRTYLVTADGDVAFVQAGVVRSLAQFQQLVADHLGVQL